MVVGGWSIINPRGGRAYIGLQCLREIVEVEKWYNPTLMGGIERTFEWESLKERN